MKVNIKMAIASSLALFTIAAFAATTAPTTTPTPTLAGEYKCTRVNADNNNTTSYPLTITSTGETYTLQWANPNGYPTMYGTGVMTKTMNNVMSVVFWDVKDTDIYGNEVFEIKPDGSLSANWVLQSDSSVGSETCTKS